MVSAGLFIKWCWPVPGAAVILFCHLHLPSFWSTSSFLSRLPEELLFALWGLCQTWTFLVSSYSFPWDSADYSILFLLTTSSPHWSVSLPHRGDCSGSCCIPELIVVSSIDSTCRSTAGLVDSLPTFLLWLFTHMPHREMKIWRNSLTAADRCQWHKPTCSHDSFFPLHQLFVNRLCVQEITGSNLRTLGFPLLARVYRVLLLVTSGTVVGQS